MRPRRRSCTRSVALPERRGRSRPGGRRACSREATIGLTDERLTRERGMARRRRTAAAAMARVPAVQEHGRVTISRHSARHLGHSDSPLALRSVSASASRQRVPATSTGSEDQETAGGRLELAADERHLDLGQVDGLGAAELGVPVFADRPDAGDGGCELLVRGTGAHEPAQVVPANGEEARVELAVGREPRPRAVAAERLRDGGDDADLAAAVAVAIPLRDLAAVRRLDTARAAARRRWRRRSRRPARRRRASSRSCARRPCTR